MFDTIFSKTFLILTLSLINTTISSQSIILFFQLAFAKGASFVSAITNEFGQQDLVVDEMLLMRIFKPIMAFNIASFLFLMYYRHCFPFNLYMMFLFTLTTGFLLGIILISIDENLGFRALKLTVLTTFLAAVIGMYSGINFSFLKCFLFALLLLLIIGGIYYLYKPISKKQEGVNISLGIVTFIGYLLFDFNNLKKVADLKFFNSWDIAFDLAIGLYLDMINLIIRILRVLHH